MAIASVVFTISLLAVSTGCSGSSENSHASVGDTISAIQPIPPGVDPRMVERRPDGVLIASRDSLMKTPGYVVDSIFPPEEALRRFQAEVSGPPPTRLAGGAPSMDRLLRDYWALLVRRDTLAMSPLVVTQAEFAYLYYPESDEGTNGIAPNVAWLLLGHQSGRGLTRALREAGDKGGNVAATTCSEAPQKRAGRNIIYGPCGVIVTTAGVTDTVWVAKTLISRDGVHKLMGFHNEL